MNLPEDPALRLSAFRPPSAQERPWWWRLEDAAGEPLALEEYADQRFTTRADAESWVGETWADLAELGVAAVTLLELDRVVYGPMSLSS